MHIKNIILYNKKTGKNRVLTFSDGMNIIAGTKNTGKSAIIPIIEYCLGESKLEIKGSIVSENVDFYAVIYQFKNIQVIVAKPKPLKNGVTETRAFYQEAQKIEIPSISELENNLNYDDNFVKNKLSNLLGIADPFSIQNTLFLLFQDKQTIARKDIIFYKENKETKLSISLSYFLGITQSEDISLDNDIKELEKQIRQNNSELNDYQIRNKNKLEEGKELLQDVSIILGLTHSNIEETNLYKVKQLLQEDFLPKIENSISRPESLIENLNGVEKINIEDINKEINNLEDKKNELDINISTLERYLSESEKYGNNVTEEINRLKSAFLFTQQEMSFETKKDECPLCFSKLKYEVAPPIKAIKQALDKLNSHLNLVKFEQSDYSTVKNRLEKIIEKRKEIVKEINAKRRAIKQISDNNPKNMGFYKQALSTNNNLLKMQGAIELYLKYIPSLDKISDLQKKIDNKNEKIKSYKNNQNATKEANETNKQGCLKSINNKMGLLAEELSLEDEPFISFDKSYFKAYLKRNSITKQLIDTTGKSDIVGYHLSLYLALHYIIQQKAQQLPKFLVLDQPAQGYAVDSEADKKRVSKIFNILSDLCKEIGIQIIITEHFQFENDETFRNAMIEKYWTGEYDKALVPSYWY